MSITVDNARESVPLLAKNLLSKDPVLFNSAINTHFAAHSTYKGHGLQLRGASGIKHVAYLLNSFGAGRAALLDERSVSFEPGEKIAKVEAIRFLKPRFFPFFELAMPVRTTIIFEAPSGVDKQDNVGEIDQRLLVSRFEDEWYAEKLIKTFPIAGNIYVKLFAPIVSFIVLTVANVFFKFTRSFRTSARHAFDAVEPRAKSIGTRADHIVPQTVKAGLHRGIDDGMNLAHGYGEKTVNFVTSVAKRPLELAEWISQKGVATVNAFLPKALALPKPYLLSYDDDSIYMPSLKKRPADSSNDNAQQRKRHEAEADLATQSAVPESEATDEVPPQNDSTPHSPVAATVQIEPKEDSQFGQHSIDIASRIGSDVANDPAPLAGDVQKESFYDKITHGQHAEDNRNSGGANHASGSGGQGHGHGQGQKHKNRKKKGKNGK
ncbi:hypothetical protein K437DRAFT_271525 [Tilletiaria anomala UBC 951]|uniref:Uncharacterized protein n=1 Tax=Tilletiaria anomala (strain ATCC 24038 / CBS 436.72 / UBC 951) TaxID=1037660 RepID=A0A066WHW3_TILAU|nr:uncharacterized protein K437DRAFT_271525 [Tilletiaria anomala UBC 951]KDN53607.1 hypothetical protein K437DRAFT_271525 [Tilletiaria anomala UBC 951]